MKRLSSRILSLAAKLFAVLTTIFGCSSKANPDKPRVIRWHSGQSGYEGTSQVPSANNADTGDKK